MQREGRDDFLGSLGTFLTTIIPLIQKLKLAKRYEDIVKKGEEALKSGDVVKLEGSDGREYVFIKIEEGAYIPEDVYEQMRRVDPRSLNTLQLGMLTRQVVPETGMARIKENLEREKAEKEEMKKMLFGLFSGKDDKDVERKLRVLQMGRVLGMSAGDINKIFEEMEKKEEKKEIVEEGQGSEGQKTGGTVGSSSIPMFSGIGAGIGAGIPSSVLGGLSILYPSLGLLTREILREQGKEKKQKRR